MQPTLELKTTRYEVSGGIATLTLSRPHRHNAWTGRMHTEYRHLLACADADPEVRVVVVTGEGRAFCVGGDSQALDGHAERGSYDPGTAPEIDNPGYGVRPQFDTDFAFQFGLTTPVIAAVNGAAAGVGLAVVVYADLRFAASVAGFGQLLQGGIFTGDWDYDDALGLARGARGDDPHGYRAEFINLVELAQSLSPQSGRQQLPGSNQ